ncbi:hypothetical protein PYCC9005_000313 [Savitreella phatthalungensis]
MHYVQTLAFLASAVSALQVTAPAQGASISQADNLAVTWSAVSSDSTSFNVEVALATNSAQQTTVATNVSPSAGGVTVPARQLQPGNYTVNLVATSAGNSGILAQSSWFLITAAAQSSSSSNTGASSAATAGSTSTGTAAAGGASGTSLPASVSGASTLARSAASSVASRASASGSARASGSGSGSAAGAAASTSARSNAGKVVGSIFAVAATCALALAL